MNPYEPPKTSVDTPSFLNVNLMPVSCAHCAHSFQGVPRKSFLGFRVFTCPQCHKETGYPLFRGYRITYWVLLALAIALMFDAHSARPNIFVLLMGLAVSIDTYRLLKRSK